MAKLYKLPKLIALCTSVLFFYIASAQTEPCTDPTVKIDSIDLLTKTNSICSKCVSKGCYRIKVVNMNPLLYSLKYNSTDITVKGEATDNLLETLIGKLDKKDAEVPKADTDLTKTIITIEDTIEKGKRKIKKFSKTDEICEGFDKKNKAFGTKFGEYKSAKSKLKDLVSFCLTLKAVCLNPSLTREVILNTINNSTGSFQGYLRTNKISDFSTLALNSFGDGILIAYKSSFNDLKDAMVDLEQTLKKCKEEINGDARDFVKVLDQFEETKTIFSGIASSFEKFNEAEVLEAVNKVAGYYVAISRPYSFTQCITIACGDIDSSKTEINFYSLSDTAKNKTSIYSAKFDLRIKGGMRHFRSPGLMLNFGGVRDERFFLDKDSVVRQEARRNKGFPSLAYVENFYWRSCTDLAAGFSFGLAANLNNISELTSLRFFLGPSLFIGEKSRFVISSGVTGGFSDRLIGKFEQDKKVDSEIYKKEAEKLTNKNWTYGFYVGISYKIFN
jgi:hypothetical protein